MTEIPPPDCPAAVIFIGAMLCSGTDSLLLVLDRGLRSGKSCDGDAERAAGDVRQANLVAEFDRGRVAALLAADAKLDVRAGLTAQFRCHLDKAANAGLVQLGERIGLIDLTVIVGGKELTGVVAGEAKVICVRSFVPKEKNTASLAMASAVSAARGISIMVPTL